MTICIATNLYYPSRGGVPNYYYYLARSLAATGHAVIVIKPGLECEEKNDSIETPDGITVVTLHTTYKKHHDRFKNYFRPGDYEVYSWLAMGYAMKEWLLQNAVAQRIDIIETPDYGGLAILLKDEQLPPVLIDGHSALLQLHPHDFIPDNDHTSILKKLETLSFKYADGILAHSIINQHALETISSQPVHFARAPWIVPVTTSTREKIKGKYIVVGRLHMIKGPAVLAEAVRLIIQQEPGFTIEWIGQDTHTAPGGKKVSGFLQQNFPDLWGKSFTWKGPLPHEKILEETASAEVAFIPSRWETFNYFALEAAYLSTPFIITDQTGSEYLFKDQPGVSIVPAGSAPALAASYFQLKKAERTTASQNEETREYLAGYFSAAGIVGDRLPIYEKLIQGKTKDPGKAREELAFLNNYLSLPRKTYYSIRRTIKSLIGKK